MSVRITITSSLQARPVSTRYHGPDGPMSEDLILCAGNRTRPSVMSRSGERRRRPAMRGLRRWTVEVYVGEDEGRTYAEAALQDDIGNHVLGKGGARLNPADPDVPEIGDEIAVARALVDLGHRLLTTAAADLRSVTHEAVTLTR
jgi:hypothetical protein